jgi:hypothetical protein
MTEQTFSNGGHKIVLDGTIEQPEYTTTSTHNYKKIYMEKFTWKDYIKAAVLWALIFGFAAILSGFTVRLLIILFKIGYHLV